MGWKETVNKSKCGHCDKLVSDHSHNQLLKCFYTNELNLYNAIQHINKFERDKSKKDDGGTENV